MLFYCYGINATTFQSCTSPARECATFPARPDPGARVGACELRRMTLNNPLRTSRGTQLHGDEHTLNEGDTLSLIRCPDLRRSGWQGPLTAVELERGAPKRGLRRHHLRPDAPQGPGSGTGGRHLGADVTELPEGAGDDAGSGLPAGAIQ